MPRCTRSWLAWLLPALLVLLASPALAAGAPRLALVVGNAAYPARPLATAGNDAALVAQALAQTGFEVTAARDLDATQLRAALAAFVEAARAAGPDATLFVYFAGYGVQYAGGNFFVPVDARLIHDEDVPAETASLEDFARALAAVPAKARLLVADASHPHPFATADEMPLAPGLGMTTAPKDTIVAFAAAPGMVAPEDAVPYGAYARALAETIAAPGLSLNVLFDQVRLRVGTLTNGEQVPWDDGAVDASVTLISAASPVPAVPAMPPGLSPDTAYSVVIARDTLPGYAELLRIVPDGPIPSRIRVLQAVRREAMIWQAAAASDDPRAAWTYMRRYPRGPHRFDARRRLAVLHAALEPPPRFDVFVFPALPPPTLAELPLVAAPEQALHGLPAIPPPPAALLPPPDPAYYEDLPMPAPAPPGLLAIAPPLPGAVGGEPGRIMQARPGRELAVSETQVAPNGSASVTLADTAGPILALAVGEATGDTRTLVETGPAPPAAEPAKASPAKGAAPSRDAGPPVLSQTTVLRTAEGVSITQVGADGGTLLQITTRAEADGTRVTQVTDGSDKLLASWRRDAQGVVVAREVGPIAGGVALAAAPASVPAQQAPPAFPTPSLKPSIAEAKSPQAPAAATPAIVPIAPTAAPTPVISTAPPPAPPKPAPVPPAAPSLPAPMPMPAIPVAPAAPPKLPRALPVAPPPPSAHVFPAPAPVLPRLAPPAPVAAPPAPPPPEPATLPPPPPPPPLPPASTNVPLPPRRPAALAPKPAAPPKKPPAASRKAQAAQKKAPAAQKAPAVRKTPAPRRGPPPRPARR